MTEISGMEVCTMECYQCKEQITLTIPRAEVENKVAYSMVIFVHEKPQVCPKCGLLYACAIKDIVDGIRLTFLPLRKKEQSSIITPTGNEVSVLSKAGETEAKIALMPRG